MFIRLPIAECKHKEHQDHAGDDSGNVPDGSPVMPYLVACHFCTTAPDSQEPTNIPTP